jgi:maltodextrin utilization protein YvdJ
MDGWKQISVASVLVVAFVAANTKLLSDAGLRQLRLLPLPVAGIGVLYVAIRKFAGGDKIRNWLENTDGLKLFAVGSILPAIIAIFLSLFSNESYRIVDIYVFGLPLAGLAVLGIRWFTSE